MGLNGKLAPIKARGPGLASWPQRDCEGGLPSSMESLPFLGRMYVKLLSIRTALSLYGVLQIPFWSPGRVF